MKLHPKQSHAVREKKKDEHGDSSETDVVIVYGHYLHTVICTVSFTFQCTPSPNPMNGSIVNLV